MVDRGGAELDREPHARARAELVAVHAQAEPGGAARLEHRARLLGVERAVLAEDVDPARVRRARRSMSPQHERDVVVGRPSYSAGTTCAPRNVTSSVSRAATSQERRSVSTSSP